MKKSIVSSFSYRIEDTKIIERADKIAKREGLSLSQLIVKLLTEHGKNHSDGNPVYTMDHYVNSDFLATPALMRDSSTWGNFINKTDDKTRRDIEEQCTTILNKINSKNHHGDANTRAI